MKTFKVTWKCKVLETRQAFVNAETEAEARAQFDNGNEYGTRTVDARDLADETGAIRLKECTKDCGCTQDEVCSACIPF